MSTNGSELDREVEGSADSVSIVIGCDTGVVTGMTRCHALNDKGVTTDDHCVTTGSLTGLNSGTGREIRLKLAVIN